MKPRPMKTKTISIVIPAKNEAETIESLVIDLRATVSPDEVIVVNDGSTDETAERARGAGATVINHPYSKGNGAAIKSGARAASSDVLVFLDGDGQHRAEHLPPLLAKFEQGFDMVIGARQLRGQASASRAIGNFIYNKLASWITGQPIPDLTSGLRVVDRAKFCQFLYLLPNGFSYPTTSTMAFLKMGYSVTFQPFAVLPRQGGKSHISLVKDGARFLLIIFRIGTLYSPLKLFAPISLGFFLLGLSYYGYTFINFGRFTNMSALLLITAVLTFLIGLVSEQITQMTYSQVGTKSHQNSD